MNNSKCFDNFTKKYVPGIICTDYFNALKGQNKTCDLCEQNYAFIDYFRNGQYNFTTCTNCKYDDGTKMWSDKKKITVLPKNHPIYKDRYIIEK
jgi:hypothetical protein